MISLRASRGILKSRTASCSRWAADAPACPRTPARFCRIDAQSLERLQLKASCDALAEAENAQVFEGTPEHPAAQRLQEAVRLFRIPREALNEIIAGVEMDLDRSTYETFEDLYPYCYRVASAVGLCCIEIFGYSDRRAREYAVDLGVALQLTNIMRDVEPDARAGRVYLPQEDLKRFGVTGEDLAAGRYTPEFVRFMEHEAARAHAYYERAWAALPRADAHTLFAAEIMGRTYFALLRLMERRRFRVFGGRVRVPTPKKLAIALRCWVRSRWAERRRGHESRSLYGGGHARAPGLAGAGGRSGRAARSRARLRPLRLDILKVTSPGTKAPAVFGHEVVGEIAQVGAGVARFRVGQRIVAAHHVPCFTCHYCRRGSPSMCRHFKRINLDPGGFAELCRVPRPMSITQPSRSRGHERRIGVLHRAARLLPPRGQALPGGAGRHGDRGRSRVHRLPVDPGVHARWGHRLRRRSHARPPRTRRSAGARVFDSDSELERELGEATGGRGADVVMLTAGGAVLLPWAATRARDGGHLHYFAGGGGESLPVALAELYHRELTISTTYSSSPVELREAFDLLSQGRVKVDGLITHRLPLARLAHAVELMQRQEAVKVYITP